MKIGSENKSVLFMCPDFAGRMHNFVLNMQQVKEKQSYQV